MEKNLIIASNEIYQLKGLARFQKHNKCARNMNNRYGQDRLLMLKKTGECTNLKFMDHSERITLLHIIYNRLRKRKPHMGSVEEEQAYIEERYLGYSLKRICEELEIDEVLYESFICSA